MCVGEGANVYGEEYKKEGEEIVFVLLLYRSKRVTERSIRFSLPPTIPEPAFRAFLSQQPERCSLDTGSWSGGLV